MINEDTIQAFYGYFVVKWFNEHDLNDPSKSSAVLATIQMFEKTWPKETKAFREKFSGEGRI